MELPRGAPLIPTVIHAPALNNIIPKFDELTGRLVKHPREMLDLICVADLVSLTADRTSYTTVPSSWEYDPECRGIKADKPCAMVGHMQYPPDSWALNGPSTITYQTVGAFLCSLLRMLAWEDPTLQHLADYFRMTGIMEAASGFLWELPLSIYSTEVRQRIEMMAPNRAMMMDHLDWDEWGLTFT